MARSIPNILQASGAYPGTRGISTTSPALFDVVGVSRGDLSSLQGVFIDQLNHYLTTGIERDTDLRKILDTSSGIRRYQSAQEAHVDGARRSCPAFWGPPTAEMRRGLIGKLPSIVGEVVLPTPSAHARVPERRMLWKQHHSS